MQQVERLVWYLILGTGSPTLCPSMRGLLSLTPSCGRMWQGGTSQGTYSCSCGERATSSKHPPSLRLSDKWKRWANWLVKFLIPETLLFGSSSSAESLPCHVAAAKRRKMNCTHLRNERVVCFMFHFTVLIHRNRLTMRPSPINYQMVQQSRSVVAFFPDFL